MYEGLDFDQVELADVMNQAYAELLAFITTPEFRAVFDELMSAPPEHRPRFVLEVLLDPDELARRGVVVPNGILIQQSAFGDRRPTLFAVKKFLPEKYHVAWENVNWTFNNDFDEADVPVDPESAWRLPLAVPVQNALIATGADLQAVPSDAKEYSQNIYEQVGRPS